MSKNGDGKCTLEGNCRGDYTDSDDDNVCGYDTGEVCCHDCQVTDSCDATGVFYIYKSEILFLFSPQNFKKRFKLMTIIIHICKIYRISI